MRDSRKAADRRPAAENLAPPPTTCADSSGLGMGQEDFLAIKADLISLRTDVSGLSSRQDKLEACH